MSPSQIASRKLARSWVTLIAIAAASLMAKAQVLSSSPTAAPLDSSSSSALQSTSAGALLSDPGSLAGAQSGSSLEGNASTQGIAPAAGLAVTPVVLPASQLLRLFESNPALTVEVKSAIADKLTAQGTPTDPNSFTDEQFFEQISSNAALRADVSTYLRARGYVSNDEFVAAAGEVAPMTGSTLGALPDSGSISAQAYNGPRDRAMPTSGAPQRPTSPTVEHAPAILRRPTPYNLDSLRDLYTQLPQNNTPLHRFGADLFAHSAGASSRSISDAPLDVPLGPDYVVGPGDALSISLWGGTTQTLNRTVARDGSILLPEAGSLQVAGLTLGSVETLVQNALGRQFRAVKTSVTVSRLRSVRVYVVGDVQRPGGYDVNALATPLAVLSAAGGPTASGSLRIVNHMRGVQAIERVDLYDLLLRGMRAPAIHFESGDTLVVPPAGPQIAIAGAVRRPAIYELTGPTESLQAAIDEAGGLLPAASTDHVVIERIERGSGRRTITLGDKAGQSSLAAFQLQEGDRIVIGSILPYSEKVIYLTGHVARPGRLAFREGMQLSDVLQSRRDLLPEPASHAELIRLAPPDLHAETIPFDLNDVLIGNQNLALQSFDTVRILGRYELDAPTVTVTGEVQRPGAYPLSEGMTAAQLVRMAGGFKRAALRDSADLTSYDVQDGQRVAGNLVTLRIGAAVDGSDPRADKLLQPGDVLTIREITGWGDIGQSITIEGQVRFPGTYGFRDGDTLSTVLQRAGGLRETAYPEGAVLVREQVKDLEQKSRDELVRQIQTNAASARISPNLAASGDAGATVALVKAQQDQALADLKAHPPVGRMVIHISGDIASWTNTVNDVELRRGDVLTIPKRPGFVLVTGQVFNGTALTFTPGKTAGWYLSRAGGASQSADRKDIFVIRANGTVVGRHSAGGWFNDDVLRTQMNPGDVVVVPQKIIGASLLWRNLLTTAQLASSIAITAAVAGL